MTAPGKGLRRRATPLVTAIAVFSSLLLGLGIPPASAETWSARDDNSKDDRLARENDIRSAVWNYSDSSLTVTSTFRRLPRNDFSIVAVAQHADEGYQIFAYTQRRNDRQKSTLRIDYGGSSNIVKCPGLKADWKFGRGGTIRITIPNKCTFSGWDMDRFEVWAAPPGAPYPFDWIESPQRRASN